MPVIDKLEAKLKGIFSSDKKDGKNESAQKVQEAKEVEPKKEEIAKPEVKEQEGDVKRSVELSDKPVFTSDEAVVVFVLGGPGAGKGTQCEKIVKEFGFVHLSAGDLLREEQKREGSPYGQLIANYIKEGQIVPMEITVKLLQNAMEEAIVDKASGKREKKLFLIDGFPRKMDQAHKFEQAVCPVSLVLFLQCPQDVLLQRLLERGKTSGRADDNEESIKKRFKTFIETSMPVVEYYRSQEGEKVAEIDTTPDIDTVYQSVQPAIKRVV
ncbi:UMP-CMP kinase [Atractiella rhizophila]|nr:UMP-CMP kinase [Atractiella rhizophila]